MCYEAAHPAVVLDEPSVVFLSTTSAYLHGLATLTSTNWVCYRYLSDLPLLLSTFAGCFGRQRSSSRPFAGYASTSRELVKPGAMALCGAYRRLATQVAGRLRYAPLCLTTAERAVHTTDLASAPPEPKAVPIPKLKDRLVAQSAFQKPKVCIEITFVLLLKSSDGVEYVNQIHSCSFIPFLS